MSARISGVLICAFAMYSLYIFVPAFLLSAEFAADLTELSAMLKAPPLDHGNWLMHWRVACAFAIFCSALGVVAGAGMFFRRRWSWLLLAGIALGCVLVNVGINLTGYSTYAFEALQWPQNLIFFAVAAVAIHAYRKHDLHYSEASNA